MIGATAALWVTGAVAAYPGQPTPLPHEAHLRDLAAAHPALAETFVIGCSRAGREIRGVRLANADGDAPANARPALVLVAGLNALHRVGIDTAVGVAERLAADHPDVLKNVAVYVIPCVNPDALARSMEPGHILMDWGGTIAATDADRDGRIAEDPGEDLNGDGVISVMRVKDPAPGTGLRAQWAADPENPGLLKKPDPAKGERAQYALVVEGIDNDGDGKFNEDGPGGSAGTGVDLEMNFPYRWPEFRDGAGRFPLSEPESRALVDWMLGLDNVAAVLVFGPGDTLVNVPPAGRMDQTGQVPLGIEEGDRAAYEEISKAFKEITGMTGAPALENAGTFQGWAYAHYGVLAFQTPVWVRPDLVRKDEARDGERGRDAAIERDAGDSGARGEPRPDRDDAAAPPPAPRAGGPPPGGPPPAGGPGRGGRRGGRPGAPGGPGGGGGQGAAAAASEGARGEPATDDDKWFAYDRERVKAGEESGFIEWRTFDHPQLGEVEIGGWRPGFKHNPPPGRVEGLVEQQTEFVASLLSKLPRLVTRGPWVERLGPGLWRVTVRVVNEGYLPSMAAIGVKARRATPTLMAIDVPLERLVGGEKISRTWSIAGSGGMAEASWIVSGSAGDVVTIRVRPSVGPARTVEARLTEAER